MSSRKPQTDKRKATRARSWTKNQEAKQTRMADQAAREQHNREVGSTGKQRANAVQKLRADWPSLEESNQPIEQEDLLET